MPDSAQNTPPKGDMEKAEKYINQLVELINQKKILVDHTDLSRFDPSTVQDHYTLKLEDYQIEISRSKHTESDKFSHVMIFNNFKNLSEGLPEKVILAFTYLTDGQFSKFKLVADRQIEERRKAEEEKQFNEALKPIDNLLDQASGEVSNKS